LIEPSQDKPLKIKSGRMIATGLTETVLVQRRPVVGSRSGRGI
jgi:hypothetical protein